MAKKPSHNKTSNSIFTPTADYVAYHAGLYPDKIAIIDNKLKIRYGQFCKDVEKFIVALDKFGLEVGQTAAIGWTNLYEHWLMLIAFEALGVTTITYTEGEIESYWAEFDDIDLVICPNTHMPPPAKSYHNLTDKWIKEVFSTEIDTPLKRQPIQPETILRIHCSSGTTGKVKHMKRSAKVHDFRVNQFQFKEGYTKKSQFLFTNGFSVHATYGRATACLRMGGICVITPERFFLNLMRHNITHICVLPLVLEENLARIPKNYTKPDFLSVSTFGGPLSDSLRRIILKDFATDLIESYGTNEVGSICTKNTKGSATILPNVTVEVLNDAGKSVIGETGIIRIKSDGMIDGYVNNAKATANMFKSGWFYPGDIGILTNTNTLKVQGRADDLLNIGGIKVNPVEYEEIISRQISAKEICFTTIKDRYGNHAVWIAIVLGTAMDLKEIQKIMTPRLPVFLGTINYIRIDEMPRTETGKIQRKKLAEMVLEKVSQSTAPKKISHTFQMNKPLN